MYNKLKEYLKNLAKDGIALAYSGGVDSSLLLAVLAEINRETPFHLAVLTMRTALQSKEEIIEAQKHAEDFNLPIELFSFNPFSLEDVKHNHKNRCYQCKKAFFTEFLDYVREHKLKYLLDGTNIDDLKVYRPGYKAVKELGIISPFVELNINKKQIRDMARDLGLDTAEKPANPCLATRFAYDTDLNDELIAKVAKGETYIKNLFPKIKDVRLRVHGNLARIEVDSENMEDLINQKENMQKIVNFLKENGFDYIALDLEGFRSGSFDIEKA